MSVTRQQGKGRSSNASPIRQLTIKDEREGRDVRHEVPRPYATS